MSEETLDLKELLERVQDDRALLLELVDIFNDDFLQKRKMIQEAIQKKDFEQLKRIVHTLKGASGNLSAKAMYATCIAIEQKVKTSDLNGLEELIKDLDRYFEAFKARAAQLKNEL